MKRIARIILVPLLIVVLFFSNAAAAGKTNALENAILLLLFQGTAIADLAANDQSSPATTLTVSLHTADPGDTGTMATSEVAYTGYARVTVARSSAGWTVTGNSVSPVANIDFGECTAACSGTITHFGIGTGVSNNLMYSGALSPTITLSANVVPRILPASTISEE